MKKITILGIHSVHDAGAAIVQNGKILAAINEERITNIKHHAGVPQKSIEEGKLIKNFYDRIIGSTNWYLSGW